MVFSTVVKERVLFSFEDRDGDIGYVSAIYDRRRSKPEFSTSYDIAYAEHISDDPDELLKLFYHFASEYEDYPCKLIRVTETTEMAEMEINDDEMREVRQRIALSKLNEGDIKALGIGNIATYIKTKFHGSE